ncbi:MAG: rod shape-determining protein [Candidatus Bipolaricaulia bacterium]
MFGMTKLVGIDLGTVNTLAYTQEEGIILEEPSVVAIADGDKVLAIGSRAHEMVGKTPSSIQAIRPLKDGVIADFDITREMIRRLFLEIRKQTGALRTLKVAVCVPSRVTEVEKRAILDATLQAGARRAFLIEEPMAAAIGVGLDIGAPRGNMIIDIGGGTTDIAVISLGRIVVDSSMRLGGNEFDQDIVKFVKDRYSLIIGENTAETVKKQIGRAIPHDDPEMIEVKGRDMVSGLPRTEEITSLEVHEALTEHLDQIVQNIKGVLERTPPELAADIIDQGIVMTGGGSLLRGIDQLISDATLVPVSIAEDSLRSVVKGAGAVLDEIRHIETLEMIKR